MTTHNIGVVYHAGDNKLTINVDGVYGTEVPYDGAYDIGTAIKQFFQSGYSAKIRNIQRIDITSYDEGKAWVDEQMLNSILVEYEGEEVTHNTVPVVHT